MTFESLVLKGFPTRLPASVLPETRLKGLSLSIST